MSAFKLVAAFATGFFGGALVNRLTDPDPPVAPASIAATGSHRAEGLPGAMRYALIDLLGAIGLWLMAGVLVAALIHPPGPAGLLCRPVLRPRCQKRAEPLLTLGP